VESWLCSCLPWTIAISQLCCNVREHYSQFNGSAAKKLSIQETVSQFNGPIELIDLSRNRCLIPKSNMTPRMMAPAMTFRTYGLVAE
jgi:hypothetical protein